MGKKKKKAISPTRAENYPEWYQQVVRSAELAETSAVPLLSLAHKTSVAETKIVKL